MNPTQSEAATLSPEHMATLARLLVDYSYLWEKIGTALNFRPQDLKTIEATPRLIPGAPESYLLELLHAWVLLRFRHTLAPTVENLKRALTSQIVGLVALGSELEHRLQQTSQTELDTVENDQQSITITALSPQHLQRLTELLVMHSFKWKDIGFALHFKAQDLHTIEANPHLIHDAPASYLTRLLQDWLQIKFAHALPPTVESLKNALASQGVGLGALSGELEHILQQTNTAEHVHQSIAVTTLSPQHLSRLTELLIGYAYMWKKIGLALSFHPDHLESIAATPSLLPDAPKSYLIRVLQDWLEMQYDQVLALPPTVENLKIALTSQAVGLQALGSKLEHYLQPASQRIRLGTVVEQSTTISTLEPHHLSWLAEFLITHSHLWKEIGLALGFLSQDLETIEANPHLHFDGPQSYLIRLLQDWLEMHFNHALPPTVENLKKALTSGAVGLGELGSELEHSLQQASRTVELATAENELQSTSATALSPQHLPKLVKLLMDYSFKWRSIGVALNFQSQELQAIEANPLLVQNAPESYLISLLQDWLQMTLSHTLTPTVENLKKALTSRTVGLKALGSKLELYLQQRVGPGTVEQSATISTLEPQHLSKLTEFLITHSHFWKKIGIALGFLPQDLETIEANPLLFFDRPKSYLIRLLQDWIQMSYGQALPPTVENLKKALTSKTVGLIALGSQLQHYLQQAVGDELESVAITTLGFQHLTRLVELLKEYSYKWKVIGIALNFYPQDLENIEATPHLMPGGLVQYLERLLHDWIQMKFKHTLLPTIENLEKALTSETVQLGALWHGELQHHLQMMKSEAAPESEFIKSIEEAVSDGGKTDAGKTKRKLAHCVLVGPTGAGKSSLLDRLVIRLKKRALVSTGVSDAVVMVNTLHSVTVLDSDTWREEDYDVSLMQHMKATPETAMNVPHQRASTRLTASIVSSNAGINEGATSGSVATSELVSSQSAARSQPVATPREMTTATTLHGHAGSSFSVRAKHDVHRLVISAMTKMGGFRRFKHFLEKGYSLYFRDTGGQVEFQEIVSLLIFGPSIFLFVFSLDCDFKGKFTVEYRSPMGGSINRYISSITTEEALLQCLASVYAMVTPKPNEVKTHEPLVFVIGTHKDKLKDKLGSSADEEIASLNRQLDSLILDNGFGDLVQYADKTKRQVMFTVDNTVADSDEDFKSIRSKIHHLISGRNEFTIDYPISYLLFCMELQSDQRSILTVEECKRRAAKYGIVGDQVFHLLHFLHLRIGVIQYYDIEGVRHIIVKEPQVFFNKVTDLVVRTFSRKSLTSQEADEFEKKGILTVSKFESVVFGEDGITPEQFLKILVHLRIVAPFKTPGDTQEKYFIPCVLNHVSESTEETLQTDITPLYVGFRCKHCPKGLFGVVVTHIMAPEESEIIDSSISFTLIQHRIYKDQVSFEVHSLCEQDKISLKLHPSHLEINFYPELSDDRDTPVALVCNEVRLRIETALTKSIEDLHYNGDTVGPVMSFKCKTCNELHQVRKGKKSKIFCPEERKSSPIPSQARFWYNEVPSSPTSKSLATPPSSKRRRTSPSSPKTRPFNEREVIKVFDRLANEELLKVGVLLGLRILRLKKMKQDSFSSEVAVSWLREDDDVAEIAPPSWNSLAKALEEAGFTGVASDVKKMESEL